MSLAVQLVSLLVLGGSAWALIHSAARVRRHWRRGGRGCTRCGYADAGVARCPECGDCVASPHGWRLARRGLAVVASLAGVFASVGALALTLIPFEWTERWLPTSALALVSFAGGPEVLKALESRATVENAENWYWGAELLLGATARRSTIADPQQAAARIRLASRLAALGNEAYRHALEARWDSMNVEETVAGLTAALEARHGHSWSIRWAHEASDRFDDPWIALIRLQIIVADIPGTKEYWHVAIEGVTHSEPFVMTRALDVIRALPSTTPELELAIERVLEGSDTQAIQWVLYAMRNSSLNFSERIYIQMRVLVHRDPSLRELIHHVALRMAHLNPAAARLMDETMPTR